MFGPYGRYAMKMSRRESMQFSATALAGLSLAALKPEAAAAQAAPQPQGLVDTQLRNISTLPLKPDGSAGEHMPQQAGADTGALSHTKNLTPGGTHSAPKHKCTIVGRGPR